MKRGLEKRLDRLFAPIAWEQRMARNRRVELRATALLGEAVRGFFTDWGIDPARAPILRTADEAAAELAAIPDSDELARADADSLGWDAETAEHFWWCAPDILRWAERSWREGTPEPDFGKESLSVIFAWCLARFRGPDGFFDGATED